MDRLTARRFNCRKDIWCCHHDSPQELQRAKKKKALFTLILLGLSFILTGCMGIYEGGFECPPGEGTKCKSLSEVNDLVNKGEIPLPVLKVQESEVRCFNSSCPLAAETPDILTPDTLTPAIWWTPDSHQWSVISDQSENIVKPRENQEKKKEKKEDVSSSI